MRGLAVLIALAATPAAAHHEVAVATSIVPMLGVVTPLALAALAVIGKRLRKRQVAKRAKRPA